MARPTLPSIEECYTSFIHTPPRLTEPRKWRKKLSEMSWREILFLVNAKDFEEVENQKGAKGEKKKICPICHHYQNGPLRGRGKLSHHCPRNEAGEAIVCSDWTTCPTAYRSHHRSEVDDHPQTEVCHDFHFFYLLIVCFFFFEKGCSQEAFA